MDDTFRSKMSNMPQFYFLFIKTQAFTLLSPSSIDENLLMLNVVHFIFITDIYLKILVSPVYILFRLTTFLRLPAGLEFTYPTLEAHSTIAAVTGFTGAWHSGRCSHVWFISWPLIIANIPGSHIVV